MATSPPLPALLEAVQSATKAYQAAATAATSASPSPYSEESRALARAAQQLADSLKPAEERIWAFIFQPTALACLNIAFGAGIMGPWSTERMSSRDLAEFTGADQKLVARVMRALCLYGIFTELAEEVYTHSPLSETLASSPLTPYYKTMAANQVAGILKIPAYIASISYRNPGANHADKTYFQYANDTPLTFFQTMTRTPAQMVLFQKTMAAALAVERQWDPRGFASLFPFEGLAGGEGGEEGVVLVEIGGGHGHVLRELKETVPGLKGAEMVLEDLPAVVEGALVQQGVRNVGYDFFKEMQPVKGARAYLLRHVLLDWSDSDCQKILRNTIPAMEEARGSRILVAEPVLPPVDPTPFKAMMDVTMLRFEGTARKEREWRELFQSVGLRVVKIWAGNGYDSIMELVPVGWGL